jgi:ATP-dependent RNA helicase DOB1
VVQCTWWDDKHGWCSAALSTCARALQHAMPASTATAVARTQCVHARVQVAAGISSGDCLVLTELLFNGTLAPLTAIQLGALLSCFIWSEAGDRGMPKVRDDLEAPFSALRDAAKRVGAAQADAGMAVDVDAYVTSFRPDLIDSVMLWANGVSFLTVKNHTKSIFEGSLVRALRRLHELLLQLKTAVEVIGDLELAQRFEEGAARLNRDVVFAASLYL